MQYDIMLMVLSMHVNRYVNVITDPLRVGVLQCGYWGLRGRQGSVCSEV